MKMIEEDTFVTNSYTNITNLKYDDSIELDYIRKQMIGLYKVYDKNYSITYEKCDNNSISNNNISY